MGQKNNRKMNFVQSQRLLLDFYAEFGIAARANQVDKMKQIMAEKVPFPDGKERSVKVNEIAAPDGYAALHHAARGNATAAAEFLIENGAQVNIRNHARRTPLHAAGLGHDAAAVARFLIEKGGDVNAQDALGRTPLHFAAKGGHAALLKVLLDARADARIRDGSEFEPLHHAALSGNAACTKILFEAGGYERDEMMVERARAIGLATTASDKGALKYLEEQEKAIDLRRKGRDEALYQAEMKRRLSIIDAIARKHRKPPDAPKP